MRVLGREKGGKAAKPAKPAKVARPARPPARPARPGRRSAAPEPRVRLDVDERRAQLIELGLEHFGTRAYDDVSIDAIAAAASISKGLLYHYFPTKRAYYAATVREAAAQLLASCEPQGGGSPLEQLAAGLDAYLSFVRAHAPAYATLMRSGVGVDPAIALIVDETRAGFVERVTAGFDGIPVGPSGEPLDLQAPLVRVALRGWVGFAEAASLAWSEAIAAGDAAAPTQSELRDLLAAALGQIVRTASR